MKRFKEPVSNISFLTRPSLADRVLVIGSREKEEEKEKKEEETLK